MFRSQFVATPTRFSILATRTGDLLARLWGRFWDWQARRATSAILHGLDDRTLRDIGIHRAEIGSLVYGAREGQRRAYDATWREHLRGCH